MTKKSFFELIASGFLLGFAIGVGLNTVELLYNIILLYLQKQ